MCHRAFHLFSVGALALGLSLLSPAAAEAADGLAWAQLLPGLHGVRADIRTPDSSLTVTFVALRFDSRSFHLRAFDARDRGEAAFSAKAAARAEGAIATINGSFFDENNRALGLLISGGKKMNPLRKVDWGIFYIADGQPHIVHTRDWTKAREKAATFGIQTGPRLVVRGEPTSVKPSFARRSALCIHEGGRVSLIATDSGLLLSEMAAILRRPEAEAGFGCTDAINLDGGSSTQLHVNLPDAMAGVRSGDRVPIILGLFPN